MTFTVHTLGAQQLDQIMNSAPEEQHYHHILSCGSAVPNTNNVTVANTSQAHNHHHRQEFHPHPFASSRKTSLSAIPHFFDTTHYRTGNDLEFQSQIQQEQQQQQQLSERQSQTVNGPEFYAAHNDGNTIPNAFENVPSLSTSLSMSSAALPDPGCVHTFTNSTLQTQKTFVRKTASVSDLSSMCNGDEDDDHNQNESTTKKHSVFEESVYHGAVPSFTSNSFPSTITPCQLRPTNGSSDMNNTSLNQQRPHQMSVNSLVRQDFGNATSICNLNNCNSWQLKQNASTNSGLLSEPVHQITSSSCSSSTFSCSQLLNPTVLSEHYAKPPKAPKPHKNAATPTKKIESVLRTRIASTNSISFSPRTPSRKVAFKTTSKHGAKRGQDKKKWVSPTIVFISPESISPTPLEPPGFTPRLQPVITETINEELGVSNQDLCKDDMINNESDGFRVTIELLDSNYASSITSSSTEKCGNLVNVNCAPVIIDENGSPENDDIVTETHADNQALISNITAVLCATCASNNTTLKIGNTASTSGYRSKAYPDGTSSLFFSLRRPAVDIRLYVTRLIEFIRVSRSVFIVALSYLDRVHRADASLALTDLNVHRLLIVAIGLAAKYLEDEPLRNTSLARIGGVPTVAEFNMLEMEFLRRLDWDITVDPAVYEAYCKSVL